MSRAGSAASFASQSQYSESTVLNQDLGEPDLFVPEHSGFLKAPFPTKAVHFSGSVSEKSQAVTVEEMTIRHRNGDPQSKAEMLMARLVDRPANSQVLRMVNSNAHRNRPTMESELNGQKKSVSQPCTPSPEKTTLAPRPPTGLSQPIVGTSFRTTMFKRDYQRRQNIIKAKQNKDLDETPLLSVEKLHRPRPAERAVRSV